jgi:hypothetical protein
MLPEGPVITAVALPDFDGSALLAAVTVTGLVAGTEAGARKSTLPEMGAAGAAHGFEPGTQICPTIALPFGIPFTDHSAFVSEEFVTFAANDTR